MREYFFLGAAVAIPLVILGAFLWAFGKAIFSLFTDWRLGKELDELTQQSEARRDEKRRANEQRLDTGCDHDFESGAFGLPPNACRNCGLEKEKSTGPCDHVWRVEQGPVPRSTCEKCGRKYSEIVSS